MYPHTKFEHIDQSYIPELNINVEDGPLFLYGITADKGEEGLIRLKSDFKKRYGELNFDKHGQAQLQAYTTLQSGGEILVKRIVAPDSTLANSIIVAKVKEGAQVQKADRRGNLYWLLNGEEVLYGPEDTADPGATEIMIDTVEIIYEIQTIEGATSIGEIDVQANLLEGLDESGYQVYPLFTIYDNGRGESKKRFRISPDYTGSRTLDFTKYKINVIEDSNLIEEMNGALDPDLVYLDTSFSIENIVNKSSLQIKSKMYGEHIENFIKFVEEKTGITDFMKEDILFGKNRQADVIQNIIIDPTSVNLTDVFGISLFSGENGTFGKKPVHTDAYATEMGKFFGGELDDSIYDLLQYPIEAIIDCNYPEAVKRKIEEFVDFREDISFFEDMNIVTTMEVMKNKMAKVTNSRHTSVSNISYDIYHPEIRQQITVTIGYGLSKILPNHFKYGRNRPISGKINDAILADAIEGTVNYVPKVTPKVNQKQELNDMRCNYANWINGELILQTQYTTQRAHTQLSYISNVLAMQEVVRAVRNRCPATRYSFIDGEDLETYKSDVQNVLNKYSNNFRELTFEYIQDDIMVQNKVFYASIKVKYRRYVQAEYFKIYSID